MINFQFKSILLIFCLCFTTSSFCQTVDTPKISFSFDDGSTNDFPGYKNAVWNQMLLDKLAEYDVKAVLFVKGANLDNEKGAEILHTWDRHGHLIGNHTYNHPYFNSDGVSLTRFETEFLKNDSLIREYQNYAKMFRFPYLKEGNTVEKRDGFRAFLKEQGYKIGHVTIDASDWYIDGVLVDELKKNRNADLSILRKYYVEHLVDRALFYDSLAFELTGRRIKHNLLLHHNLGAALFLDDLIERFQLMGWEIVDAAEAYEDEIYQEIPQNLPAGESLIWALAKESGRFESVLRYPAEDSKYEEEKLSSLIYFNAHKVNYVSKELKIEQLTENTFLHVSYLKTEDFGNVACNGMIVVDGNEAIIVDTPADDATSAALIDWIKHNLKCESIGIVVTHFHVDCLGGLDEFHSRNIPSYASEKTIALAKSNQRTLPENDFSDSLEIQVGTKTMTVRFVGEGHTIDNVVCYVPSEKVLFGGCLIKSMGSGKGNLEDANTKDWSRTAENVRSHFGDAEIVVPGHGKPGGQELLYYTIKMFRGE